MEERTTIPDWLDSTLAADAIGPAGAVPSWVQALAPGSRLVGRVATALAAVDDNGVVHTVTDHTGARGGDILVVTGAAWSRTAMIGDLMARELLVHGITGMITDGLIRDAPAVRALPLAVWCRGVTTVASRKERAGAIEVPVSLGGVIVNPGDLVVADDNGVVVWPATSLDRLLAVTEERRAADLRRLEKLEARLAATAATAAADEDVRAGGA